MVTNAYNIRAKSAAYLQKLEQQFGVNMISEDETFYQHNCLGKYKAHVLVLCVRNGYRVPEGSKSVSSVL